MAAPGARVVEITAIANTAQLEAALERSGVVAESSAKRIKASYEVAGKAAATAAAQAGKSADEQADAAGRAAAAQVKSAEDITKAQSVAADAAKEAAAAAGLAADEQVAAARRAMDAQKDLEASSSRLAPGGLYGKIGKATLIATSAAIAGVSYEAVRLASEWQKSVASIAGNAGIPVAAAKKIGDAFLNTAGYMTMSGNDMAAAFAPVAGQLKITEGHALDAAEALKFMKVSADLAEGSQTSLGSSTSSLSQILQSFHLSVSAAASASDTLFNTSRALNVPITTVAAGVEKLHGRLGVMMPSLSEVSSLMIRLGQTGMLGTRSIQVAQTALSKLVGGSTATSQVLEDLGIKTSALWGPKGFLGMSNAIDVLRPKLENLTSTSQKNALMALFGQSAWQVMGQIIAGGTTKYAQATDAANKLGTAHKAASEQAHTLGGEVKILEATLSDLATKLGNVLIPVLTQMGQALMSGINWMEQHKAVAEALAAVIATVLGAAVAVFAEQKAVAFGKAVKGMMSDLQRLGGWITSNLPEMGAKLEGFGNSGLGAGKAVGQGMTDSETALQDAKVPLATAAAEDGAAIDTGMWGYLKSSGTTALAGVEGEINAAKAPMAADAATDGTAAGASFSSAFIAGLTVVGLAAAGGYLASKAANKILGTGYQSAFNTKGKTAQQILAGNTTLVHGESLYKNNAAGASIYSTLYGEDETSAQIQATIKALQATGDFKGGIYQGGLSAAGGANPFNSAAGGNAISGLKNQAAATAALPAAITTMLTTAQALVGTQYTWGGGHGSTFDPVAELKKIGVDCSGFVSAVLHAGGVALPSPQTTQGLPNYLQKGAASASGVTVWDRTTEGSQDHTIINIAGHWYESGGNPADNPAGGVSNISAAQAQGELAGGGFAPYHPKGLAGPFGANKQSTPQLGPSIPSLLGGGGSTSSGGGGLTTGKQTIGSPSDLASVKTITSLNDTLTAAIERYTTAAKTAKSPEIEKLDHDLVGQLGAIKQAFDQNAKGLSGQPLTLLIDQVKKQVTAAEQNTSAQVKNATTFEAMRAELVKQEEKYKSAAASAATPLLAKLDTATAALIAKLDSGFHSVSQDTTTKAQLAAIEAETKARVKIGTAAGSYSTAALSATSPILAQLDQHFAKILGDYATGKILPGSGVVGRVEQQARTQVALAGRGTSLLSTMQSGANSGSYTTLETDTSKIHKQAMDQLVQELVAVHESWATNLAGQLTSTFKVEEAAKNNTLEADNKNLLAAMTTKVTTEWADANKAMVQAITDAAKTLTDASSAIAQSVSDQAQSSSDAASAQATSISDAAQITVDTLGERGLYGLNLVAQQMQVAADQQKMGLDAQIAAAQQVVDQVTQTQDAAVASAQSVVDNVTQRQDSLVQNAQAHLDAVTAIQNAAVQVAQNQVNEGVAGSQAALQAAQGTAAATEAQAGQALEEAQSAANSSEAQANSALSAAQAAAAVAVANAEAALSNAQGAAQIAEAQSQAEIAILKEQAATQFAGSGTSIYITGLPLNDAAAVASEVSWVARSQFTAPIAA